MLSLCTSCTNKSSHSPAGSTPALSGHVAEPGQVVASLLTDRPFAEVPVVALVTEALHGLGAVAMLAAGRQLADGAVGAAPAWMTTEQSRIFNALSICTKMT